MSPKRRRRRSTPTPAQIWRILRATAREARIARRQLAATERRIALRREQWEREQAERDRKWEREQAERDRKLERELYRILRDGDNRWGALIEALVQGNIKTIFRAAGLEVEDALARRRSRIGGVWREYDLVAVGDRDALVVEVKSTLREADVPKFQEQLANFRQWRPDDARPRIFGAMAYLTAEARAVQAADDAGLYRVQAVSGSARLVNAPDFTPRVF